MNRLPVKDLLNHIFEGKTDFLAVELDRWVKSSRRFKTFVETYRDKIRKKHRLATSKDGLADLWLELETAYWLLHDKRFEVEYEALAAHKQRSPDFTVKYRANTRFNIEVTRIRSDDSAPTPNANVMKLMRAICEKAGQMPPSTINILVLGSGETITSDDLVAATAGLRALAERKDEAFFTRQGYQNAAEFVRQFQRLSGIVMKNEQRNFWLNPQAKHPIPKELMYALGRLETDGASRGSG